MIEFEIKKKKDKVLIRTVYSDDLLDTQPGDEFEIDRKKFDECVRKYKQKGREDSECDAIIDLVLYGKCYA